MPRKPYRNPRDWVDPPEDFGAAKAPKWLKPESALERALLRGALQQHALVRRIKNLRDEMPARRRLNNEQIAAKIDLDVETIQRTLSGKRHATLTEIEAIASALGTHLDVGIPDPRPQPTRRQEPAPDPSDLA